MSDLRTWLEARDGELELQEMTVLLGKRLYPQCPLKPNPKARCLLPDRRGSVFTMDDKLFSRHVLIVGAPGVGKTNLINWILYQIKKSLTPNDVLIIFDTKGDFYQTFWSPGDVVIANDSRACGVNGVDYWNIFAEMLVDSRPEDYANEIAYTLLADKISRTQQPFFPNAAKDLLAALLVFFTRLHEKTGFLATNEHLRLLADQASTQVIRNMLSAHVDMRALVSYISHDESPQTQGVISEFQQVVRSLFIGNFAKSGSLSIRKLVRQKGGRTIFVEYDIGYGSLLTPIYVLLIDQAIKEVLGQSRTEGNVWIVIDEFRLLPRLQYIENAINLGRGLGLKVILAMQDINQVYASYDEKLAKSIIAGCSTLFAYYLTDSNTREYISAMAGKQRRLEFYSSNTLSDPIRDAQEGKVVEDWMLSMLDIGQCFVMPPQAPPFLLELPEYKHETCGQILDETRQRILEQQRSELRVNGYYR